MSPSVAATPVIASNTGMPAATRAPKANTRIARVIGKESVRACLKSLLKLSLRALSAVASPASSMRSDGCAFCAAAVTASSPSALSSALSASPRMSKVTSAEWPSFEICPELPGAYGERTSFTWGSCEKRVTTSFTPARKPGSCTVTDLLWTSTCSLAGRLNSLSRSLSARPELPVPLWASVSFLVPIALPSATDATTKTIHPITAVFQWRALQRPLLAAMFWGLIGGLPFCGAKLPRKDRTAQTACLRGFLAYGGGDIPRVPPVVVSGSGRGEDAETTKRRHARG